MGVKVAVKSISRTLMILFPEIVAFPTLWPAGRSARSIHQTSGRFLEKSVRLYMCLYENWHGKPGH